MKRLIIEIGIVALFIATIFFMGIRISDLQKDVDAAVNNVKAYSVLNDSLKTNNRLFQLRIADMELLNDSLFSEMIKKKNELRIKDNKIRALQYQIEHYDRTEIIYLPGDTIFKSPDFKLDTCISDEWGKTCLELEAPNKVEVGHSYINKKHVIFSSKKEPVKERKWFLPRWFTRKHTVVEAIVIDENPYVETRESRFVDIID